ncbi:bifunctional precorrin-2 dehydrogenase/sirohydrochlorin ferrochelatase [Acetobacterium wieringae]|uniref:precorrin-2 dehydrogenase n=1 Tax=Acetobacterium wieringae TaxID=52694 RepID=A0ABY6HFT5_9FIRM|nr:bifunctional precorrin-2 dehydrogenase/sirohydrochlorin ferrochelatase [Acetobacterium wieringae]UYO63355.1 bifunctional precorrin-2 dehydrogenase/sirohydrochlorin ferrochelatase [Acetobacterium wieringae]VUZ24037.1 Precorrin-2 dehydrogenase [Acetobacterium wieringae]
MMTPLLFNLKNKKVLVVGGGKVAARRIVTLLENGMQVIAVSPDFSEGIIKTENNQLTLIYASYHKDQLADIDLAVAATDNRALNGQIKKDCQAQKIWCNRVDDPDDSDFIFPSVIRRGDLTLSVCTEGASPFLTKQIVAELAEHYDDSYTEKTALLRLLRQAVLAGDGSPNEKTAELKALSRCSNAELRSKLGK